MFLIVKLARLTHSPSAVYSLKLNDLACLGYLHMVIATGNRGFYRASWQAVSCSGNVKQCCYLRNSAGCILLLNRIRVASNEPYPFRREHTCKTCHYHHRHKTFNPHFPAAMSLTCSSSHLWHQTWTQVHMDVLINTIWNKLQTGSCSWLSLIFQKEMHKN